MGTTVHKTYRLDSDLLERIDAWAADHETTPAEAVRLLLANGLEPQEEPRDEGQDQAQAATILEDEDQGDAAAQPSPANDNAALIEALQATVDLLKAQLVEKDAQIKQAQQLADQAQQLHAASIRGYLETPQEATGDAVTVEVDTNTTDTAEKPTKARRGFWARLFGRD